MSNFEEQEIRDLLTEAPMAMHAELTKKLRMLAGNTPVRKGPALRSQWMIAGAGFAAVAIIVGLAIAPVKAEAKTYAKVVQATGQADSFQLTIQGKSGPSLVIAGQDGKFGLRDEQGALLRIDGSKMEIYDRNENTITSLSLGGLVDPKMIVRHMKESLAEGLAEMDVKKMLEDFHIKYGDENIHVGPIVHGYGKSTFEVALQKPGDPERVLMTVNADSNLPERILVGKMVDGEWEKEAEMNFQFGGAVDPSIVNPVFPANAKRVEMDLSKVINVANGLQHLDPKAGK